MAKSNDLDRAVERAARQAMEFARAMPPRDVLKRGLVLSALFGMGLVEERIESTEKEVRYSGVEKRWLILRWLRVSKVAKLRDVQGIHDVTVSYPILLVLVGIALVSAVAEILDFYWWWGLDVWRLPYLWGGTALGLFRTNGQWIAAHFVVALIWLVAWRLLRRHYIVVDITDRTSMRFRTSGIARDDIDGFKELLHARWNAEKGNASPPT